jgi:phosphoserine phosphatase RsbU/P
MVTVDNLQPQPGPLPGPGPGNPGPPRPLEEARILIVDDQGVNRLLLTSMLHHQGYSNVETAEDGLAALEAVERFHPDLMLLDIVMPLMDGFEVCRRVRAGGNTQLPIIVQTALTRGDDRRQAFAAGATDLIGKPVHGQELLARIKVHLTNQRLVRELEQYRDLRARELRLARSVHERGLPSASVRAWLGAGSGLSLDVFFEPSQELGGDFWDARLDDQDRLCLWTVDFSGHGVAAAMNALRLQSFLRRCPLDRLDPAAHLGTVNAWLKASLPTGQFATILMVVFDRRENQLRYASAGAPDPIMLLADGSARLLQAGGMPAGISTAARQTTRTVPFPPGSTLLTASDGFSESTADGQLLGDDGLLAAARSAVVGDRFQLSSLMAGLRDRWIFSDDLTAISISRPPQ